MAFNGLVTYPPPPGSQPWQPVEPTPTGDPVYAPQPYPYPAPEGYGGYPAYGQPYYGQPYYGQPPYGWAPLPTGPRIAARGVGWGLAGSGLVIVIAAFMTWATVLGLSIKGTDGNGDGSGTFVFGAVVLAMGIVIAFGQGRVWTSIVACVVSSLTLIVALYDVLDTRNVLGDAGYDPSSVGIGAGLWLTLLGAVAALALSIAGIARRAPKSAPGRVHSA